MKLLSSNRSQNCNIWHGHDWYTICKMEKKKTKLLTQDSMEGPIWNSSGDYLIDLNQHHAVKKNKDLLKRVVYTHVF